MTKEETELAGMEMAIKWIDSWKDLGERTQYANRFAIDPSPAIDMLESK